MPQQRCSLYSSNLRLSAEMETELRTIHASIDASRARLLLEEAKADRQRLHQLYSDCFFDGSIAAAESAVQFALKETDSIPKALELADVLKSLPTAIPDRNALPLAEICAFLTFSFSEEECRAPLNTFCYADSVIRRTALRVVFKRLRHVARMKTSALQDVLKRLEGFFDGIVAESVEIERRIVVGYLVGLANGMSAQVRQEIFYFIFEMDIRSSSYVYGKQDIHVFEDYDAYFTSELASLAGDDSSMAQVVQRGLVHSLEFGTTDSLFTLWTCHRSQILRAIAIIGRDSCLFLLMAHAARLACFGDMSGSRHAIHIARGLLDSKDGSSVHLHEVIRSALVTFCASMGATSSACGAEDVNIALAQILHCLRASKTHTKATELLEGIRHLSQNSCRWECPESAAVLGLLLKMIELWASPPQLKTWLGQYLAAMLNRSVSSNQRLEHGSGTVTTSSAMLSEEMGPLEIPASETFGTLVTLLGASVLSHPISCVRLETVEVLRKLDNSRTSLFCLPSILMHLQREKNGVVAVKIIRELLCSRSILQDKETSKIALSACVQSLGHSSAKDPRNNTTYETVIAALGYATETSPGLATSLLLREVEKLKKTFGLTKGPIRASATSAILKLVQSRPSRGTNFIPFISLCISPESMKSVPEAASLCFEAMNVIAEEEVLDPIKAVKIVMKNFPDVADVAPQARRSYLMLLGSVSRGSSTKKGVVLANKVVNLLRRCLNVSRVQSQCREEGMKCSLSWDEVEQTAKSLSQFTVDEILRLAYASDEPLLDVAAEAERRDRMEKDCQDFVQGLLSLAAAAHNVRRNVLGSLRQLLIKIASREWENRQRSSFDPDRIAKLRAASDALRRARRARGVGEGDSLTGIDGFARAVRGLPTGVMKGIFQKCVWDPDGDKGERKASPFWIAIRVVLRAKALSPALPWAALVTEVIASPGSHDEERASCLAVLRVSEGNTFELKNARSIWFGPQSPLFDSSLSTSLAEAEELFIGMVHFNPSEVARRLFKFKAVTSSQTVLAFIRASGELQRIDLKTVAQGLFPVIMNVREQDASATCELIEREFYEVILVKCEAPFVEELLMNNITEPSAIRILCLAKSFKLMCHAANVLLEQRGNKVLLETIGLTIRSFDAPHRREFVLDACSGAVDHELRQQQYWLAAYVYGVEALLPYTDLALSVAVCFCADADRDGVAQTIASIMSD